MCLCDSHHTSLLPRPKEKATLLPGAARASDQTRLRAFAIRTTTGPTPFANRFRFSLQDGATIVDLEAAVRRAVPPTCSHRLLAAQSAREWTQTSRR